MAIQVGDHAPGFSLPGSAGEAPIALESYRGRKNVVILFFPLAWTGVCTTEMCTVRDGYSKFGDLDAEVVGISVDSPFALRAWAEEQGFTFPLLSDFNRDATRAYDVLYDELLGLQGVAKRAAFVVDKEGIVRYAEVCPSPKELPDFDGVRGVLASLS